MPVIATPADCQVKPVLYFIQSVFILLVFACSAPILPPPLLSILAPQNGACFETGFPVVLKASGGGTECRWLDDTGRVISVGATAMPILPEGDIRIVLEFRGILQDSVTIAIEGPSYESGSFKVRSLSAGSTVVDLASG